MEFTRKMEKKWFGLLVLVTGIVYLGVDVSNSFDFFGISIWTAIVILSGIFMLSVKNPLTYKLKEISTHEISKKSGKWFGFLLVLVGLVHLLADVSTSFDFFGIHPITSFLVLIGFLFLSKQNPISKWFENNEKYPLEG